MNRQSETLSPTPGTTGLPGGSTAAAGGLGDSFTAADVRGLLRDRMEKTGETALRSGAALAVDIPEQAELVRTVAALLATEAELESQRARQAVEAQAAAVERQEQRRQEMRATLVQALEDVDGGRVPDVDAIRVAMADPTRTNKALTLSDVLTYRPEPENNFLAGTGWIRRGQATLLTGATGIGKSVAAEQIAYSVAGGVPIFGCIRVPRSFAVRHYTAEQDTETMQRDLLGIGEHVKADPAAVGQNLSMLLVDDLSGDAFVEFFEADVLRHRPDLAILDSIQAYQAGDLNASADWHSWFRPIIAVCRQVRCALLLVDHPPKPSMQRDGWTARQSVYSAAGTSSKANAVRCSAELSECAGDERRFRLRFGKNAERTGLVDDGGRVIRDLYIEHSNNAHRPCWLVSDDQTEASASPYESKIRALRAETPDISQKEAARRLKCSPSTVNRWWERV